MIITRTVAGAVLAAGLFAAVCGQAAAYPQATSASGGLQTSPPPGSMDSQSAVGSGPAAPATALLGGADPTARTPSESPAPPPLSAAAAPQASETMTVSSGPVPDTPANRAKYGAPLSRAGQQTDPAGN